MPIQNKKEISEHQMMNHLSVLLDDAHFAEGRGVLGSERYPGGGWEEVMVRDVQSFEAAGVLTNNKGLVIRMEDGSEYQIQIVKSK